MINETAVDAISRMINGGKLQLTDEQKAALRLQHAQMIYDILTVQPMTRGPYSDEEKNELACKLNKEYNTNIDTRI